MSKVALFPGLDISQRQQSFRARVRLSPFYDLTKTFPTELDAAVWGTTTLQRLHLLRTRLKSEERLPAYPISREEAVKMSLSEDIEGIQGHEMIVERKALSTIGDQILVSEIIDSYVEYSTKLQSTDPKAKATLLKNFFADMTLADVTMTLLNRFKDMRASGALGSGRSTEPADYLRKNREYQARLRAKKRGTPLAPSEKKTYPVGSDTIRKEIGFLRLAVKAYLQRVGDSNFHRYSHYIAGHPIFFVTLPAKSEPRKRRVSNEEVNAILSNIKCSIKRAAFLLVLYLSLRRAEILSLRVEDINWEKCEVLLRAPLIEDPKNPGKWIPKPKSKTRTRMVPLIPEALKLLEKICHGRTDGKIFNFSPSVLSQAFGRGCSRANIIDLHFHDGRRECVSWLHDTYSLTMEELTVFTGHTDVGVLIRHYFEPSASKLAGKISARGLLKREFNWENLEKSKMVQS